MDRSARRRQARAAGGGHRALPSPPRPAADRTVRRSSPEEAAGYFGPNLEGKKKEVFRATLLDNQNGLLRDVRVSEGSRSASTVHSREVFRTAIPRGRGSPRSRAQLPVDSTRPHAVQGRHPPDASALAGGATPRAPDPRSRDLRPWTPRELHPAGRPLRRRPCATWSADTYGSQARTLSPAEYLTLAVREWEMVLGYRDSPRLRLAGHARRRSGAARRSYRARGGPRGRRGPGLGAVEAGPRPGGGARAAGLALDACRRGDVAPPAGVVTIASARSPPVGVDR